MTTWCGASRPELPHHASQAFRPIAGAEGAAVQGDTLNQNFFGVV